MYLEHRGYSVDNVNSIKHRGYHRQFGCLSEKIIRLSHLIRIKILIIATNREKEKMDHSLLKGEIAMKIIFDKRIFC